MLHFVKILKRFGIGVPNLLCISLGHAQEFNKSTMSNMGYHWIIILRLTIIA